MDAIYNWIDNHNSTGWLIAYFAFSAIILFAYIWMIRFAAAYLRVTNQFGFTIPKIIITSIAPVVFCVMSVMDMEPPSTILLIVEIIACLAVIIWNIISYKVGVGILFSILHVTAGFISGLGAAAIVFVAVFAVAMLLIGGSSSASSSSSGSRPGYVRDPATGESFYTDTDASGQIRLPERGDAILRPSSYAGRYIDDYGNEYIAD